MSEMFFKGECVGIKKGYYGSTGNLYLGLVITSGENKGELLIDITKETTLLPANTAPISFAEGEELDLFIRQYKLGEPTGENIRIGLTDYPIYRIDISNVNLYAIEGV